VIGRRVLPLAAVLAAAAAPAAPAGAATGPVVAPPPGAAACSGCHPAAAPGNAAVPPLDGQPAEEIVAAMLAYRAGERGPTVMDRIAKGFTDDEIRAIAGWLAGRGG
jgi:cytochrome c553